MPVPRSVTLHLAHAGPADAGWIGWLPYGVAVGLAVGVSLAADALFKIRTFGDGNVRRFATLTALILLASAIGLGVFYGIARLTAH